MKLEFIVFFFDVMLEEHFHTKRRMARILDIELRTLQYNFERIGTKKGQRPSLLMTSKPHWPIRKQVRIWIAQLHQKAER